MSLLGDIIEKEPKNKREICKEYEGEVDRISTLPNYILLYIMAFMTTKEAIQTCILSKRWKDLWKYLPNLIASNEHFQRAEFFKEFVCKVLLHRDDSSVLHNIDIQYNGYVDSQFWGKLINYAISHNVEQFKIDAYFCRKDESINSVFRSIFSYHSLKYLDLSLRESGWVLKLPQNLDLPELVKCHLKYVAFSPIDNSRVEPFPDCKKLSTLVIDNCSLFNADYSLFNDKDLFLSSDKLSNLTIRFGKFYIPFRIQIFAPNLKSFAFIGHLHCCNDHIDNLVFKCNLDFLEKASIEALLYGFHPNKMGDSLKNLLKALSNVNSLTLCSQFLEALSSVLGFPNIEPIHFGKLMSLVVKCDSETPLRDGILNYLLQDSPLREATLIQAIPAYIEEYELTETKILY